MDFYKKECSKLQKRLAENEEIIKRMMFTNAELMGKLEKSKTENSQLKNENESLNLMFQKFLCNTVQQNTAESTETSPPIYKKPKTGELTATGHLVFCDPVTRIQESVNKKLDDTEVKSLIKATQDYLQIYLSKNNMLQSELQENKENMREIQKENEKLKMQSAKIRQIEAAAEKKQKFEQKMQRVNLRKCIFKAFDFLTVEDLLSTSRVCLAFYTKCQELLYENKTWIQNSAKGFNLQRNKLWSYFLAFQHPNSIKSPENIEETKESPPKSTNKKMSLSPKIQSKPLKNEDVQDEDCEGKPMKIKETQTCKNDKTGFFECNNYAFFDAVEITNQDVSVPVDYTLMNAEGIKCDLKEIFSLEFMEYFGYKIKNTKENNNSELEKIIFEIQQLFGVPYNTQGISVIICFLYLAMRQNAKKVRYIMNALIEDPYHLKKLYSEDYYLLNLIIFQIDYLMKQKIPDLYFYLKDQNVMLHDFCVEWVLTLFSFQVFFYCYSALYKNRVKII